MGPTVAPDGEVPAVRLDHGVDIVVATDGTWSWKDPDQLVREGRIAPDVVVEIRRRAAVVASDLDAGRR